MNWASELSLLLRYYGADGMSLLDGNINNLILGYTSWDGFYSSAWILLLSITRLWCGIWSLLTYRLLQVQLHSALIRADEVDKVCLFRNIGAYRPSSGICMALSKCLFALRPNL